MDIRLDYISKFKEGIVDEMAMTRTHYILMYDLLKRLENSAQDPAAKRAVALAVTHLEQSSMYAIKALCLIGEDKE